MPKFIMESVKLEVQMIPQKQDNPLVNISAMAEWTDKNPFNNETKTSEKKPQFQSVIN